ncbi:YceI family protein [Streptomyces sp. 4N509B]|uniref:YceI family protein n=1 Tax=Streptomyces sp. 4N509B TaxID=3457413 RepID=UPI003FD1197A
MTTQPDSPAGDVTAVAAPPPGRYAVDTAASTITFVTRHLFNLQAVRGRFSLKGGTVEVAEPLADSTVAVEVDAASFDTGHRQRDPIVRSPRFLDTERHPLISFTATAVDPEARTVTGTLTVREVTRPVTLTVEEADLTRAAEGSFSVRARTPVDRTTFGVTASRGLASRHLDLTLDVTFVRQ